MMAEQRMTANDLAQDILVRQGKAFMNEYSETIRVEAHLTAKQTSYLFALATQEGLGARDRSHHWVDVDGKAHGTSKQIVHATDWTLSGNPGYPGLLVAQKPLDWHPLDYTAPAN